MDKHEQHVRTCTVCGLQKPMSAFLQISGSQGTSYGNICSTCRGTGAKEKSTAPTPEDEQTTTSSSMRIGTKQKTEIDKERKRQYVELKESEVEETKKREELALEKAEKIDNKAKSEKEHRQTLLEPKQKQSFLNYQSKKQALSSQSMIGQKKEERLFTPPIPEVEEKKQVDAAKKLENDIGSGAPIIAHSQNIQGDTIKRFINWMGGQSQTAKTFERLYGKTPAAGKTAEASKTAIQEESLTEFVDKNWKPPSGRRR